MQKPPKKTFVWMLKIYSKFFVWGGSQQSPTLTILTFKILNTEYGLVT